MSFEYVDDEEDDEYEYEEHFSDDGDNDKDDVSSPTRTSRTPGLKELKVPDGNYIITCFSEILPYRDSLISEVSNLLDVDRDQAHLLLQHYCWEKEKLIEKFFSGSSEEVMLDVGLDLYTPAVAAAIRDECVETKDETMARGGSTRSYTSDCRICYDPDDHAPRSVLGCGHSFHNGCYRDYLVNELSIGPACILAHCPEVKCRQRVPRALFSKLLPPENMERYEMYVARGFIETSKTLRYCPSPGCDKVAIGSGIATVKCTCSHPFCFRCGEEAHEPVTCAQLAQWALKCQNESETANWILVNTKKCPQCHTRIEKNQGCNHITCTKCKHDFCWICNAPWSEHGSDTGGFYKCNKYDPSKPDGSASKAALAKQELDRYLHYYQRYHGHDSALKFVSGARAQTEKRMGDYQETLKASWIDVEFLKAANEQIIECRRVLKYTYALGFFLEDNTSEKQLFEHQQEMLEKNTEKLHRCTEMSGAECAEGIDKSGVINLTRVTERFMRSVLEEFEGGRSRTDYNAGLKSSASVDDAAGGK